MLQIAVWRNYVLFFSHEKAFGEFDVRKKYVARFSLLIHTCHVVFTCGNSRLLRKKMTCHSYFLSHNST